MGDSQRTVFVTTQIRVADEMRLNMLTPACGEGQVSTLDSSRQTVNLRPYATRPTGISSAIGRVIGDVLCLNCI